MAPETTRFLEAPLSAWLREGHVTGGTQAGRVQQSARQQARQQEKAGQAISSKAKAEKTCISLIPTLNAPPPSPQHPARNWLIFGQPNNPAISPTEASGNPVRPYTAQSLPAALYGQPVSLQAHKGNP